MDIGLLQWFISTSTITDFTVIERSTESNFGLTGQYHTVDTGIIGYEFTIFGLTLIGPIPDNSKFVSYTKFTDPDNPGYSEGYYCTVDFSLAS